MNIAASELPLQPDGRIYHLNLFPDEIADTVILVGDPGRVETFSKRFDRVFVKRSNREIVTHTGELNGMPLSVLSTGMGTDNIDIVLNELDALRNIDLKTREIKSEKKSFDLIRIGTCGALQKEIDINSFVASAYGFGMDGLLRFYCNHDISDDNAIEHFVKTQDWNPAFPYPYLTQGSSKLLGKLAFDLTQGITATASGFYGPQGRVLRLPLADEALHQKLQAFEYRGLKITNLEMETSALYALSKMLGHEALTVCLAIANRVTKAYSENYHIYMDNLIDTILERLTKK